MPMKILILNWRDIKNPKSGGAEILTHEIAKRWVNWGHSVIQFSSEFKGSAKQEIIDGVKIIRGGHPDARFLLKSVHWLALELGVKQPQNVNSICRESVRRFRRQNRCLPIKPSRRPEVA